MTERAMGDVTETRQAARRAYKRHDWPSAVELFRAGRDEGDGLSADDLNGLSDAAWWLGRVDESLEAAEEAYHAYLADDRRRDAAMAGLHIAVTLFLRGDDALASGWISRLQRLLRDEPEGPEHGYVRYFLEVEGGLEASDLDGVVAAARDVREIGERHDDPNLVAAGVLGEGRARIKQGRVDAGMVLLDEAMVAVLADDLNPEWAGNIYCHLMVTCHELADIKRAGEWTEATSRWLAQLPAAVLFTGICRVHRSQVLQVTGEWEQAEREAVTVCEDLADLHVASAAEAHYQVGEIRRLQGDLTAADKAYERARRLGRDPQPGLALLWLARGRLDTALAGIRTALLAVTDDPLARAPLRRAQAEIALAGQEVEIARHACGELAATAAAYGTSGLEAAALDTRGALELAEGHPERALPALRAACRRWQEVHAVHDAARVRLRLARAYEALGDPDAASSELAAATATFDRLGAGGDARAAAELASPRSPPGGLTEREAEVLALVATGKTNREVAEDLVLSEKTIARHLSNIFTKIEVSTRTEAAAFAFEHGVAATGHG